MNSANSTWALITGASSGIGEELARLFAADGVNVALVARRADRLRGLADELAAAHGISAVPLPADLATPEGPRQVMQELTDRSIDIDDLVNNAGFGSNGPFAATDLQSQLDMVQVNVGSLVHLTGLLLPDMLRRGRGRILNVASTAAFQPGPRMAVYYATKAFVLHFSEALYEESRRQGVTVTCLCPGPTRTEFAEAAAMQDAPLFRLRPMSAAAVAKAGYRAMQRGKPLVIPGVANRLLASSVRFMPRWLVRKVVKRLNGGHLR